MTEVNVPNELKTVFHERCLAAVNRGLGSVAVGDSLTYEIAVNDDFVPASFFRGDQVVDQNGRRAIIWWGLMLGDDNILLKSIEHDPVDTPERPTVASEEVMRRYMVDDLRALIVPDLGASILLGYLQSQNEAEKLGLLDVTQDDVLDAIATMDGLISAHDAAP